MKADYLQHKHFKVFHIRISVHRILLAFVKYLNLLLEYQVAGHKQFVEIAKIFLKVDLPNQRFLALVNRYLAKVISFHFSSFLNLC